MVTPLSLYITMISPLTFIMLASTWIPQIVYNAIYNIKGNSSLPFKVIASTYFLFIPLSLKLVDDNFMKLQTSKVSGIVILIWVLMQLIILKI